MSQTPYNPHTDPDLEPDEHGGPQQDPAGTHRPDRDKHPDTEDTDETTEVPD